MSNLKGTVSQGSNGPLRKYFVDPKPNAYNAVCVDAIDLGARVNNYGKVVREVSFSFQLADTITEKDILKAKKAAGLPEEIEEVDGELVGKRFFIRSKRMSFNFFPGKGTTSPSNLYSFVSNWRGAPLAEDEEVDLNDLVGQPATLLISTNIDKNDPKKKYTNISEIMPFDADTYAGPVLLDDTYTRISEREGYVEPPTLEEVQSANPDIAEAGSNGNGKGKAAAAKSNGKPGRFVGDAREIPEDVDIPFGDSK
jgi:hypothetical protein